jgi:hypothetical protein
VQPGDLIDVLEYGDIIEKNCLVISIIKDAYFSEGLLVYIYNSKKSSIDLKRDTNISIEKLN